MKSIRHHAATARIVAIDGIAEGVLEVRISGPMSQAAFDYFRPYVLKWVQGSSGVVVRLDTALDVVVEPPGVGAMVDRPEDPPSQAVVCHAEQYKLWSTHARRLAEIGIRRAVFLPEQLALAYRWVALEARRRRRQGDWAPSVPAPLA